MFLAGDRLEHRERRIRGLLAKEPAISVLLAASSFEWSVSRAIVCFGRTANVLLRERLEFCHGLDRYKVLWRAEVVSPEYPEGLAQVIDEWDALRESFRMRGALVHGKATCTRNTAMPKVEVMLQATKCVSDYFAKRGRRINDRIPVRRKKGSAA